MKDKERKHTTGRVVCNSQNKTLSVLVERKVKHPVIGKYMVKSKKYQVHNESGSYNVGDVVKIKECRPLSKRKSLTVVTYLFDINKFQRYSRRLPKRAPKLG